MPLPPPQTQEFIDHLSQLQAQTKQELDQSQGQLQEIRLLLGQTTNEIEKLSQRELALANRVRDMEVNLDSYSRADIRVLYNTNHEVQLRLFMTRSQAEQLEARQQNIRDYQDKLRTILELLQVQTSLTPEDKESEPAPRAAGETMIPAWQSAVAVIEGQEEERLHLSREIQDGPTQVLTNLLLHLEVCRQVLKRDVDSAQQELDGLKNMLAGALQETRRLLNDIRPIAIEDLGLVEMLRRHLSEVGRESGIETAVNSGIAVPIPPHLQIATYRLLHGSIGAMVSPGQRGRLTVNLQADSDRLVAKVELEGADTSAVQRHLDAYLQDAALLRRLELLEAWTGSETDADGKAQLTFQIPVRAVAA